MGHEERGGMMERKFKVGGTVYQRSKKYGVGKEIGGKIYVHRDYANRVNPVEYKRALRYLRKPFTFRCVMFDMKNHIVRFDEAPDFDIEREPHPGKFIEVDLVTGKIRQGHSNMIWHHKWMWVKDSYQGFDVGRSFNWSKRWTSVMTHPSGSRKIWERELEK